MRRLSDQELAWRKLLETSTNPQEIIETAAKLKMDPVTMEEATEIAKMNQETIACHTAQNEKSRKETDRRDEKKATDSATEKLALTDNEIMDYAVQLFLDSLPNLNDTKERKVSENVGLKIAGIVPTPDEERLKLMQKVFHWPLEKAQEMLQRSNARRPAYLQQEMSGRPTWEEFFDAEGRQRKEAILQQMYGGTLTPEEIEAFFPKDDD